MKYSKHASVGLIVFVLSASLPLLAPTGEASHLSWTNSGNNFAAAFTNSWSTTTGMFRAYGDDLTDDFHVNAATPATTGDVGKEHDIYQVSASILIACYVDETSDDVFFTKTTNGGTLFTTPVTVTTGTLDNCAIFAFGSLNYVVVYADNTNADIRGKESTNGGASWGSEFVVDATDDNQPAGRTIRASVKNTTLAAVAYIEDTTSEVTVCNTVNGAANWTCNTIPGVVGQEGLGLEYAGGDRFIITFTEQVNAIQYFCLNDDNAATSTWLCNTSITLASVVSGSIAVLGPDQYAIVMVRDTGANDQTFLWYTSTTDGGGSWLAPESVFTFNNLDGLANTCDEQLPSAELVGTPDIHLDDVSGDLRIVVGYGVGANECFNLLTAPFMQGTVIVASATATVTGLTGFDVDPAGQLAIIRSDDASDQSVSIYNAQTLGSPVGGPIVTNCGVGAEEYEDGVLAKYLVGSSTAQLVGFLNCDASGDAQYFSIRRSDGEVPTSSDLNGCTVCDSNIDLADNFDEPADSGLGILGQVEDFPIDYGHAETGFTPDRRQVAWAFATQQCSSPPGPAYCSDSEPGNVGVAMWTEVDNVAGVPTGNMDHVNHHPDMDVHDFCLGKDGPSYYLASVVTGQPSHTWSVSFFTTSGGALDSNIGAASNFGSSGGAVACGGGQILTLDNSGGEKIALYSRTGGFQDSIPVNGVTRGVAMSDEFAKNHASLVDGETCTTADTVGSGCLQFGAYVDDATDEVVVVNLTGKAIAEVARFGLPGGTFYELEMDRTAQNVWVATTTTVARFYVVNETTMLPVSVLPGEEAEPVPAGDAEGVFAQGPASLSSALGVGTFGANLFFGAIVMAVTAGGLGVTFGNREQRVSILGMVLGGCLGFLLAWGFGFFSTAVVFSMVLIAALVMGARWYFGRTGG